MKEVENQVGAVNRRAFVSRLGTFGLGAIGATSLLSACGSDRQSSTTVPNGTVTPTNPNGTSFVGGSNTSITFGQIGRAFRNIQFDENQHVQFLVSALGANARPEPTFDLARLTSPDMVTFFAQSDALENTGTGAYLGAVPGLLSTPEFLKAAAAIVIVEGRHAGFLNVLTSRPVLTDPKTNDTQTPASNAMEVPLSQAEVIARATPFVTGVNLNGGKDPAAPLATPIDILNFALFLEYLESRFYNINVPRFFA